MTDNSANQEYRSLTTFSYFPVAGLAITAFVEIITVFLGLAQVISPQTMVDIDDTKTANPASLTSVWLIFQAFLAVLELPVYLFTAIFFLIWLYRAYNNLYPLRAANMDYSATWAVGYWFIPILNLFRPFQVVKEVWRESDPDFDADLGYLPNNSNSQTFLTAWWAFWLLSNFANNLTARLFEVKDVEMQQTVGFAFMLSGGLTLAGSIFAMMVVRKITERQELRILKLGQTGQISPPPPPIFE